MTLEDVVQVVHLFEQAGIDCCVDGGWAVDALLGQQTRAHADLDIALEHKDVPRLRALLAAHGFRDVPRGDSWECNFVLGDDAGREVDVHSYTFDESGTCVYGVPYPAASLTGSGVIGGHRVTCISPEWLVAFHTGYALDETDYHDVKALCQRFGIGLPAEYAPFAQAPPAPVRSTD